MANLNRSHESLISEPEPFNEYVEKPQFYTNSHELPVDQSYIKEVGGNNPDLGLFPKYDPEAIYSPEDNDPRKALEQLKDQI